MLDLAIVGGGPGGLMTAWHLRKKLGTLCKVTIFEPSTIRNRMPGYAVSNAASTSANFGAAAATAMRTLAALRVYERNGDGMATL